MEAATQWAWIDLVTHQGGEAWETRATWVEEKGHVDVASVGLTDEVYSAEKKHCHDWMMP